MPGETRGEGFVMSEPDESQKDTGGEGQEKENRQVSDIEIDFSTFVLSLSSSVMLSFGKVPNPMTGETQKNLPMAKQTLDILAMLQEKTKGNLEENEDKLLDNLLADLRLQYVDLLKTK